MTRKRRSGLWLALAGLLAAGFFFVSDVRWGLGGHGIHENTIDAAGELAPGTLVGLAISAVIVLTGLWLMTRRNS